MTERQIAERKRLRDLRVEKRRLELRARYEKREEAKRTDAQRIAKLARELAAQRTPAEKAAIKRRNARKGNESRRGWQGPEPAPVSCVWVKW